MTRRRGSARWVLIALIAVVATIAVAWFVLRRDPGGSAVAPTFGPSQDAPRAAGESASAVVERESTDVAPQSIASDGLDIRPGVRVAGDARLAGRVLDRASGGPVAGARVELLPLPPAVGQVFGRVLRLTSFATEYSEQVDPIAIAATDAEGRFEFVGVRAGTYFALARAVRAVPDSVRSVRATPSGSAGPIDLFVRAGGRVLGEVRSLDDRPIAGAKVLLTPGPTNFLESARTGDHCLLEGKSDGDGRFAIAGVPAGEGWEITVAARGFALSHLAEVDVRAGEDTRVVVRVGRGGSIEGRILSQPSDESGQEARSATPLAGAHLGVVPRGLRYLPFLEDVLLATHAISDEDGRYRMANVPPGEVDVVAIAPRHLPSKGPIVAAEEGSIFEAPDFALTPGAMVKGRVVDGAGIPLEGVQVRWNLIRGIDIEVDFSLAPLLSQAIEGFEFPRTDVDGRFEAGPFAGDPPHELEFWKLGFENLDQEWDGIAQEMTVTLRRGGAVEGIVIDAIRHEPVSTFTVSSESMIDLRAGHPGRLNPYSGGELIEAKDGRFRLESVAPGKVELSFVAPGYVPVTIDEVEVSEGATTRGVIVELDPGATIVGRVLDQEGDPVVGAQVFVDRSENAPEAPRDPRRPRRRRMRDRGFGDDVPAGFANYAAALGLFGDKAVTSKVDGSFELVGVEAGQVTVVACHRDFVPSRSDPLATVAGETAAVELVLGEGGGVFGRAVDRFGGPVPGAIVFAMSPGNIEKNGGAMHQGRTDVDGHYRIEHMVAGSYILVLTHGDETLSMMSFLGTMNLDIVTVPEGEMVEFDVLDRSAGAARVFGTVTGGGEPASGGQVVALSYESESMLGVDVKVAQIKPGGAYEFKGLAPGTYTFKLGNVRIAGEDSDCEIEIDVPDRSEARIDLALPDGGIDVVVLDASTREPLQHAQATLIKRSRGRPGGGFLAQMIAQDDVKRSSTAEDGTATFRRLQAGEYELTVGSPRGAQRGYSPSSPRTIDVREDAVERGIEVLLEPSLSISGTVRDENGASIESARVSARLVDAEHARPESVEVVDGAFRIDYLGEGSYDLWASAPGFAQTSVRGHAITRAESKPVDIVLQRGVDVTVLVVGPDGAPLSGATAMLERADGSAGADPADVGRVFQNIFEGEGVSGADGKLSLGRHAAGRYVLKVQRGMKSARQDVELAAGGDVELRVSL